MPVTCVTLSPWESSQLPAFYYTVRDFVTEIFQKEMRTRPACIWDLCGVSFKAGSKPMKDRIKAGLEI